MPKKKPAASRSKLASFRGKRQSVAARNPSSDITKAATSFAMMVGPGVGGYAATRLTGKLGRVLLGRRLAGGRFEKHFGPLSSLGALIAIYFAAKRWDKLRRYQEPVMIGSAIALIQSIIQTYLPGMAGWIDAQPVTSTGAPVATGAVNGFQKGRRRKKRTGTRYVSIGELEIEETARAEREDREDADEVTSETAEASDELPPDEPESPLSDESQEIQDFVRENEQLSDLYDGVFTN